LYQKNNLIKYNNMITVREIKNYDDFTSFTDMDSDKLHVVKLGAEWCGPCRVLSSTISNLDNTRVENVLFGEVDIDNDGTEKLVEDFKVRSIPVTLFIKNGEVIDKRVGGINADEIYKTIETCK
jgi:thioredoxin 1